MPHNFTVFWPSLRGSDSTHTDAGIFIALNWRGSSRTQIITDQNVENG
jgi:hypothetical protein